MSFFEQLRKLRDEAKYPNLDRGRGEREMRDRAFRPMPTTDMGMREGRLRAQAESMLGPRPTGPTTDMGMNRGIEKNRIMEELRKKQSTMPDWMKPRFRINSLDKQNNDPLKTGSIDSFRGNTDVKPIPSATFSGSVSKIPNLTAQ
jgi:hypothetical protein